MKVWPAARARRPLASFAALVAALLAIGVERPARAETPCIKPLINKIACCTWGVTNQFTGLSESYVPVYREFAANIGANTQNDLTAAQAESVLNKATTFAKGLHARLPFVEPFDPTDLPNGSHVSVVGGWYYDFSGSSPGTTTGGDADSGHAGIDYTRRPLQSGENPTYKVHAAASGKVIFADWTELSGNAVVVAHTAPDGTPYRTIYMHLRNGAKHDLQHALLATIKKLPDGKPDMTNRETRYRLYADAQKKIADANGGTPKSLYWGTEDEKLQVHVGDSVAAGQFIAWTGDTGDGGAGDALDPANPGQFYSSSQATGNNHLHLYFAAKHPDPSLTSRWVLIDPYGIYSEASSGCYADPMNRRDYALFFAPFHSSFNGVSLDLFSRYFSYYPDMGYALQTLSIHSRGGDWLASGSFQSGLPSVWKSEFFQTESEYEKWKTTFTNQGMRPRQISVNVLGGDLRITSLWQAAKSGETFHVFAKLTDAELTQHWDTYVKKGHYRVEDHSGYTWNGSAYHAVIFVDDGHSDFYYPYNLGSTDYKNFETSVTQGYKPVTTDLEDFPWGRRLGGLWMPRSGEWRVKWGLSPAEYQAKYVEYVSQGFTLERVQGYNDSTEYLGIWRKVSCPAGQSLDFSGNCVK
jgi:hypothetical protein